jgi:hypothetical protein
VEMSKCEMRLIVYDTGDMINYTRTFHNLYHNC